MTALLLLITTALPFVVSPGTSFAITVSAAVQGDRRSPVKVWAGTALGIALIAAVVAATGVGAFVAHNQTARSVFNIVGGLVLTSLGAAAAVRAVRRGHGHALVVGPPRRLLLWSFLTVITNVKALSLYALVVPTATRSGLTGQTLYAGFATVHIVLLLAWLLLLGLAVRMMPRLGRSSRAQTVLVIIASLMMIGLGAGAIIEGLA